MPAVTMIQHSAFPSAQGNAIDSYNGRLCQAVLNDNILIVGLKHADGITATVADDQGNSYTLLVKGDDANDNTNIYYKAGITNGPRVITASFASATQWVQMVATEFAGIATTSVTDGSSSNSGTGTSLTAGAIVTTQNGDLIYSFSEQDSTSGPITSWTKGTNFTLLSADVSDPVACQFWVQSSSGSINAGITMAPSNNWISVAGAFKADSSKGTLPSSTQMRVLRRHGLSVKNADASPTTFFVPSDSGNLLVFTWIVVSQTVTGIADNHSNTWNQVGSFTGPGASGIIAIWYVPTPTTNNDSQVTVTWSGGAMATVDSSNWFEIVNAYTSPLGNTSTSEGEQLVAGTFSGASLTPSNARGIVMSVLGAENSGADYISAHTPGNFISTTTPPENISPWPADSNNGWAVNYHTTTAAISNTWTDANGPPQEWGEVMVEWIEAPVPAPADREQEGFRFRNDDGSETTATFKAGQNVNVSIAQDVPLRVRFTVNTNTVDPATTQYQFEYREVVPTIRDWIAVPASAGASGFVLAASANISASGEATTRQMSTPAGKTTGQFAAGRIMDDENPADTLDLSTDQWTELEWCFKAVVDTKVWNRTYELRVTANGTPIEFYPQTPRLKVISNHGRGMIARK